MPRQFIGVYVAGSPNEVLQKIRSWVRNLACGHVVSVVFFEKKARGNYYVFLGYEVALGAGTHPVPDEVTQVLERAGFTGTRLGPLPLGQIQSMLDPQEFDTTGSDYIPYRARWTSDQGDLFDLLEAAHGAAPTSDPEQTTRFDRLLAWLSSTREGRWETFVKACQTLGVASDTLSARGVFRRLSLLGHIEASADTRTWTICPPTLVRAADRHETCFWCGQRVPGWQKGLSTHLPPAASSQPGSQGPSRVAVTIALGEEGGALNGLSQILRFSDGPLAPRLADVLPDLESWVGTLEPIRGLTNPQRVERWQGNGYLEEDGFYVRENHYFGPSGLYRVTRGEGAHQSPLTFYFDHERQILLRGDWYGLRFLAQRRDGNRPDAVWQGAGDSGVLTLASRDRWPMLYERALVLSSGLLPDVTPRTELLRYSCVPFGTATTLAAKLGVSLERIDA